MRTAKRALLALVPETLLRPLRERYHRHLLRGRSPAEVFAHIFHNRVWSTGESASGYGSELGTTRAIRQELPPLLRELSVRSLLDAGCGDHHWMRQVDLAGVRYTGVDIVPALIAQNRARHPGREFLCRDVTADPLPRADAVLCRDCLMHLSFAHALRALGNLQRSGARYLLATTHRFVRENRDIPTGAYRHLNLELPPFCLPAPARLLIEEPEVDRGPARLCSRALGVWALQDLLINPGPPGGACPGAP